jgi:hypothetical protein
LLKILKLILNFQKYTIDFPKKLLYYMKNNSTNILFS